MLQQETYKKGAQLALAALATLVLGALIFYKERTILNDASHILFRIINEKQLQIQQYRFGAFVTQMVPLAAVKLHLPIKAVLIAYSLSFNVFYFLVAVILYFRFKAYALVILMSFYYLLIASETYYWTNNEVHQGVAWMFLFYAWLLEAGKKKQNIFIPILLILTLGSTAIFAHPLVMIPFVFLWGFLWIEKINWRFSTKQSVIMSVMIALIVAFKIYVSKRYAGYDNGMLHNLSNLHLKDVFLAIFSQMSWMIIRHAITNYWILAALTVIGYRAMFLKGKKLLAAWTILFFLAFYDVTCITFGGYSAMYSESELMPLIIITAVPFLFFTFPAADGRKTAKLLAAIFIIRLCYIGFASHGYSARIALINGILDKMKQENQYKLFLPRKGEEADSRLMVDWGIPEESLIASALKGENPQRNFVITTYTETKKHFSRDKNILQTDYEPWEINRLNAYYFTIDTTQEYTYIDLDEFVDGKK